MEPPPPFRFPKDSQPLHQLSPERINAARTISTTTTASKISRTTVSDDETVFPLPSSTHSSPTRRANLFADYHPTTPKSSQTNGFALPQSPSLPEIHALRGHARTNSDVQGLVKRFEHLDVRDKDAESVERRRKHDAELRRAQIAREEAESDVKRLREEVRRCRREAEDGRERERKVGKRLEVVMEDYSSAKEQYTSQAAIYEKEVRRAKKEAFKSSSAVLKLQEELKSTRNSLRITQSGFDLEKQKAQRREHETFNAQYQLAAVQEELDKLRAHLRIVEEEKEALKTNLKDEEVAHVAAEGMIALPLSQEDDDLFSSPRKHSPLSDDKENVPAVPKKAVLESKRLEEDLAREQMRREHAEEVIDFLGLECMFRCCRCQTAAKRHGHDNFGVQVSGDLASTLESLMEGMKAVMTPPGEMGGPEMMEVDAAQVVKTETLDAEPMLAEPAVNQEQSGPGSDNSPVEEVERSMTMTAEEPEDQVIVDMEEPIAPRPTPAEPANLPDGLAEGAETVPILPSSPQTPTQPHQTTPFRRQPSIRTISHTTTIPMHFTPVSKQHALDDAENIPPPTDDPLTPQLDTETAEPTFDRAAALAAIEYRRGRAKSFASGHMTPRKQMLEGVKERRDISAPALGQKVAGEPSYAAGASSVGRRAGKRMV